MMRRISIEIEEATFEEIAESAARERRAPRDHAGWLLDQWARALKAAGPLDGPIEFRVVKEPVNGLDASGRWVTNEEVIDAIR